MTQLPLPNFPEIDPRVVASAQAKLARIVARQRESYETRRFRERRAAALKHYRPAG